MSTSITSIVILLVAFVALTSTAPTTTSTTTETTKKEYDSSYANIVSKATLKATYIAQAAYAVADNLEQHSADRNLSLICFVEPRNFNTDRPPLDLLREDREYLIGLQNYTQSVANTTCSNNYSILCVNVNTSLAYIKQLKPLLDQIIARGERGQDTNQEQGGSGEVPVEEEYTIDSNCWNVSPGQLYWNFNALGMLADLYIKPNLKDILDIVI